MKIRWVALPFPIIVADMQSKNGNYFTKVACGLRDGVAVSISKYNRYQDTPSWMMNLVNEYASEVENMAVVDKEPDSVVPVEQWDKVIRSSMRSLLGPEYHRYFDRKVYVRVEISPEFYAGEATGYTQFRVMEVAPLSKLFRGCPLGRDRGEGTALEDFVRRANADDAGLKLLMSELEIVERRDYR